MDYPKVGYVITTTVDYANVTLPRLLLSLHNIGIYTEQISVMVAKMNDSIDRELNGVHYYHCPYNSYEMTALIGAVEHNLPFTHVFLLHDTCEAGSEFKDRVEYPLEPEYDMMPVFGAQCNLGCYSMDFLRRNFDYLNGLKNCTKKRAIDEEGALFRRNLGTYGFYPFEDRCEEHGIRDVYGNGIQRLVEHYTAVDLWKYKGNWGQTKPGTYVERA